jgi:hypothetical protein
MRIDVNFGKCFEIHGLPKIKAGKLKAADNARGSSAFSGDQTAMPDRAGPFNSTSTAFFVRC